MDIPQNVHVDIPSGYFCYWMFYYTHHRDMHIPQYVCHVKKKKGSNISILKRGKQIMKCELQISYKYYIRRLVFFIKFH